VFSSFITDVWVDLREITVNNQLRSVKLWIMLLCVLTMESVITQRDLLSVNVLLVSIFSL